MRSRGAPDELNPNQSEDWWFLALNSYNTNQLPYIISEPQYSWYNLRSRYPAIKDTESQVTSIGGGPHWVSALIRQTQVPDQVAPDPNPVMPDQLKLIQSVRSDWVGWSNQYQTWQWRGIRHYELVPIASGLTNVTEYGVIVHSTLVYRWDEHYPSISVNYHVWADGSTDASPPYYFAHAR